MCFAPQQRALFRRVNFQKWSENGVFGTLLTWKCASRRNSAHFFDVSTSKSVPRMVCLVHFLTCKCASRHNSGVRFFNTSTSKSAPNVKCFVRFDVEMCFAPKRCALFRHFNFQTCSACEVFCAFLTLKCAARRATFHLSSGQMAPHPPL